MRFEKKRDIFAYIWLTLFLTIFIGAALIEKVDNIPILLLFIAAVILLIQGFVVVHKTVRQFGRARRHVVYAAAAVESIVAKNEGVGEVERAAVVVDAPAHFGRVAAEDRHAGGLKRVRSHDVYHPVGRKLVD